MGEALPHILMVAYPVQGHINPCLQFAKTLVARFGIHVTFAATVFARRLMSEAASGGGVNFATYSDGYDEGFRKNKDDDVRQYLSDIRTRGSKALNDIVSASRAGGRPVTAIVYAIMIPWAAEVARDLNLPSALLWIQPAAVFDIYYFYFHGYDDAIKNASPDPTRPVYLPGGLPPLTGGDIPSFLLPSGSTGDNGFAFSTFKEEIEKLTVGSTVLVNTFDALEAEWLKAVSSYHNLIGIGPLIPSAFLGGKDGSDTSFGADLFKKSKHDDYIKEWLSSHAESSVVYISFGSLLNHPKSQNDEISHALREIKRQFLWVIKDKHEIENDEKLEKLGGMIVSWCSQMEVLNHPSLGCHVTHCGWNSTLESMCAGVPVVAFPHWTDQMTNAKLIQDVWKIGVRVTCRREDGVVGSEEIRRCIQTVMDGGEELRTNAKKWKDLAMEANLEGGSSYTNLKIFAEKLRNNH